MTINETINEMTINETINEQNISNTIINQNSTVRKNEIKELNHGPDKLIILSVL